MKPSIPEGLARLTLLRNDANDRDLIGDRQARNIAEHWLVERHVITGVIELVISSGCVSRSQLDPDVFGLH